MLLARLPITYRAWEGVKVFRHGAMNRPAYAFDVFQTHYASAVGERNVEDLVMLELGPGDSLFSALIAKAVGAKETYLVDVKSYADCRSEHYHEMVRYLKGRDLTVEQFNSCHKISEFLEVCSAKYLTAGIDSLRTISTGTVDFVWSHSVLQHVRKDMFADTVKELRRIQRIGGVGSHRIDLRDCLGGALNNLRFTSQTWESDLWANSGFYTNRIRYREMLDIFAASGFAVTVLESRKWGELPTPRHKMDRDFNSLPEDDLLISGFSVLLH